MVDAFKVKHASTCDGGETNYCFRRNTLPQLSVTSPARTMRLLLDLSSRLWAVGLLKPAGNDPAVTVSPPPDPIHPKMLLPSGTKSPTSVCTLYVEFSADSTSDMLNQMMAVRRIPLPHKKPCNKLSLTLITKAMT